LILLAGVAGLEPATPGFGDRCNLWTEVVNRSLGCTFIIAFPHKKP
jgi:hypothetical protein